MDARFERCFGGLRYDGEDAEACKAGRGLFKGVVLWPRELWLSDGACRDVLQ